MAHTLFILTERIPCTLTLVLHGILKSPSTNPFNLSWETKNSGCGLLRIPCHKSVSLQRVLPEMGYSALSKFNTSKVAPSWSCYWKLCGLWYPLFYLTFHGCFSKLFKNKFFNSYASQYTRGFLENEASCMCSLIWSTRESLGAPVIWSQQAGTILPIFWWSATMVGKQSHIFILLFRFSFNQFVWSLILFRSTLT